MPRYICAVLKLIILTTLLFYSACDVDPVGKRILHPDAVYDWKKPEKLYGASVSALTITTKGNVLLGTRAGEIYKSSDNGNNWVKVNEDMEMLQPCYLNSFSINKADEIFACTTIGLYKSIDEGENWTLFSEYLLNLDVNCAAFDKNNGIYLGTEKGILFSSDGGSKWINIGSTNVVTTVAINSLGYLFANIGKRIYRSTNSGNDWNYVDNSGVYLHDGTNNIVVGNKNDVFAASDARIVRSVDGGNNWKELKNSQPCTQPIYINSNGDVFAGVAYWGVFFEASGAEKSNVKKNRVSNYSHTNLFNQTNEGGIYYSSDNGENWSLIGLDNFFISAITSNSSGYLFSGSYIYGIWRKQYNEKNWENIEKGINGLNVHQVLGNNSGGIIANTDIGLIYSEDRGVNWKNLNVPSGDINSMCISPDGILYYCAENVYCSSDLGSSWQRLNYGSEKTGRCISLNSKGYIFVGDYYGVFRSIDKGISWTKCNSGIEGQNIYSINSDVSGMFIIASNKIFRSLDDGATWKRIENGLEGKLFQTVFPVGEEVVFATSYSKTYRSVDNGNTWELAGILSNRGISCLFKDGRKNIYVGTSDGRIFCSGNYGDYWYEIKTGKNKFYINSIYVDKEGYLFAGLFYAGMTIGKEQ